MIPSRANRRRFADLCSTWSTVGRIQALFDTEGFDPSDAEIPNVRGDRRTLTLRYFENVNWDDPAQVAGVVRVMSEALIDWIADSRSGFYAEPHARPPAEIQTFINGLRRDGIAIDDEGRLRSAATALVRLEDLSLLEDPAVIREHLDRISENVDRDPAAAIGSAKELVESTCRVILKHYGETLPRNASLTDLYKAAARHLSITRDAITGDSAASRAAQKALQGMASTVGALGELRNAIGTGHGKDRPSPALARHARMAAHAAQGVGGFMLETWEERRNRR